MAVSIFYVNEYPGLASDRQGGTSVTLLPGLPLATQMVLATVGGAATFTLTSRGSALASGTYTITGFDASTTTGKAFTFIAGVSTTGQLTTLTALNPGYGFKIGDTLGIPLAVIGTASSVLTTVTIATVVPCSAPFQTATAFVEIDSDGGATGNASFGSTITTAFLPAGILSTLQALTTLGSRMNLNERLVRGVGPIQMPAQGASGAGFSLAQSLQVIMGTAAS